ncbi:hypothetical protein BDW72DRAFT_180909 [Aspergillus terricola var. indicus]
MDGMAVRISRRTPELPIRWRTMRLRLQTNKATVIRTSISPSSRWPVGDAVAEGAKRGDWTVLCWKGATVG